MSATELILFSGGLDSTILLKHFLQQKKKVRVLYIEMAWDLKERGKLPHQQQAVKNVLDYLYENYGDFDYSQASIFTSLNLTNQEKYFAKDHAWCAFFGSMFCNNYNIPRMWVGNYSYTNEIVKAREGKGEDYLNGTDLELWLNCGTRFEYQPPEYCSPILNFKGESIDKFKTKKEAWDSLEMELKQRVRSCYRDQWFCGTCNKCLIAKKYKLRDPQGNPL